MIIPSPRDAMKSLTEDEQRDFEHLFKSVNSAFFAIKDGLEDSREKALALTKLEEAALWVKQCVQRHAG